MDGNTRSVQRQGTKIAKSNMMDWFIILFLIALVVVLNLIHPFHRFIGKEMISGLKYPLRSNTVPLWAVPIISVILPATIIFAFYIHRRDAYDLHHAVLGLLFSVLITAVITDVIKDSVGLPRPDFFWRCFPDGREVYDPVTGNVVCHGKPDVMKDGFKSFPSGHTSWCFSGLGFLSLYLSGKIKTFDKCGHAAKLCITLIPLLGATLVGISRIDDYWHNMHDVVAGALLGVVVALLCYLQLFPTHHHSNGSRTDGNSSVMESQLVESANEPTNANCQTEMNNSFGTSTTTKNCRAAQDDLESSRP